MYEVVQSYEREIMQSIPNYLITNAVIKVVTLLYIKLYYVFQFVFNDNREDREMTNKDGSSKAKKLS